MSLNKSVHGPFKRNCQSLNPHWFLQPEVMETSLPGAGTLDGGPGVGQGPFAPEISLLIFICHMWVWDQPIASPPLLPVLMRFSSIP